MKQRIQNYAFVAASKTVTFSDYSDINIEGVLVITNVVDNIIIYNFANSSLGGTAATNVLTLAYDTTTMSNGDELQIWYDHGDDKEGEGGESVLAGVLIQGDDGTDRKNIHVDATTGNVQVDITHTVIMDGSGVTQPVSAASLPLPSGAATSAKQLAAGHDVTVDNAAGTAGVYVQGGAATNDAAVGNPVLMGTHATLAKTAQSPVDANGDMVWALGTAEGVQYTIGGYPSLQRFSAVYTSDQTALQLVAGVADKSIVVTSFSVGLSEDSDQTSVAFTILDNAAVVAGHPGLAAGSGLVEGSGAGGLWNGVAASALKFTCDTPNSSTGSLRLSITYYFTGA